MGIEGEVYARQMGLAARMLIWAMRNNKARRAVAGAPRKSEAPLMAA